MFGKRADGGGSTRFQCLDDPRHDPNVSPAPRCLRSSADSFIEKRVFANQLAVYLVAMATHSQAAFGEKVQLEKCQCNSEH